MEHESWEEEDLESHVPEIDERYTMVGFYGGDYKLRDEENHLAWIRSDHTMNMKE